MPTLKGACYCGHIRYEVRGAPFNATLCYCADCRRIAGSPAVAWFTSRPDAFVVTRSFCADCGRPLT